MGLWRHMRGGCLAAAAGCLLIALACSLGGLAVQQRAIRLPDTRVWLGTVELMAFTTGPLPCVPHDRPPNAGRRFERRYTVMVLFHASPPTIAPRHWIASMALKPEPARSYLPPC